MDYKDIKAGATQDYFWFKGKKELIKLLLKKSRLPKDQKLKILVVGAGTGEDLSIIKDFGDLYVIDIDKNALNMVPDQLVKEKIIGDICRKDYKSNSFDLICAFDVIEHIKDDQKIADKLYHLLKTSGKIIITVPAFNFLYSAHDKYLKHFRRYNINRLKKLFNKFKIIKTGYFMFFLFIPVCFQRLCSKRSNKVNSGIVPLPKMINAFFYFILKIELLLLKLGLRFPFGLTIWSIYKKETT